MWRFQFSSYYFRAPSYQALITEFYSVLALVIWSDGYIDSYNFEGKKDRKLHDLLGSVLPYTLFTYHIAMGFLFMQNSFQNTSCYHCQLTLNRFLHVFSIGIPKIVVEVWGIMIPLLVEANDLFSLLYIANESSSLSSVALVSIVVVVGRLITF